MAYMGGIRGDGLPEGEASHDVYVFWWCLSLCAVVCILLFVGQHQRWYAMNIGRTTQVKHTSWVQ